MADQTNKQKRFINNVLEVVQEADALYGRASDVMADLFANGYESGGANALANGDFAGTADYLDAAAFYSAITALENLKNAFENGGTITAIRRAKYG